ncbi:MAG: twin-arginine translocation signal domain-containing protein [Bryobacterales bacterium]|nr:twin-arginine translocation signal domain-containing protein [Bryobacterales bacterium]
MKKGRREFLQGVTLAAGTAATSAPAPSQSQPAPTSAPVVRPTIAYPRTFRGRQLSMIAFPLGGVGAGSVSLGGRGQLRDWEIFNRPDKGNNLSYAFPAIWVQAGNTKPVARVLESRILPPYEGASGLGSQNVPGLARLSSASFTGEFPFARIDFTDRKLPVKVRLEAFTPFIPLEPDDSGLPVTVLRYTVTNPGPASAKVSIAFSIDNPVGSPPRGQQKDTRQNEFRRGQSLQGLYMSNSGLAPDDPLQGSFALCLLDTGGAQVTHLRGWPRGRWWNAPMLFWDDFSADGSLGPEPADLGTVGALCSSETIAPNATATYTFVLAWRFPNRTPERCGWAAVKGYEKHPIGNWYAERFPSAWDAAEYLAANLPRLERETRAFTAAVRDSTLPGSVKDGAMANLSTLVSTTCFRTADGEFHGFEGVNDKAGCCHGNCTHVWNYETTTTFLFPSHARSLRKAAFGYSMDDLGAIHFRQMLPEGTGRSGFAATDGQMGQILHAYLDWQLSADSQWLKSMWPRLKKALEFSWLKGGWDADKDGVMEGVQHNTYDVEFYGPNPQCGIYYLGGLRAAEEMATAVGDTAAAQQYRRLFDNGSRWIDANLFNGRYYIQKVRSYEKSQILPVLRSSSGADDPTHPEYQVGEGCLADQLVGQYLADVAGLGPLVEPANIRKALESIWQHNYRRTLEEHDSVQRVYAVNDEPALLVCSYGNAERPRIPFPYYAEAWTGLEYMAGAQMIYAGLVTEGVRLFETARSRHDGERRNPWDEPECGHHYARAMSAWSGIVALSGFLYHGAQGRVSLTPRWQPGNGRWFWSTGTGWGAYSQSRQQTTIEVLHGSLPFQTCEFEGTGPLQVSSNGALVSTHVERKGTRLIVRFAEPLTLSAGHRILFKSQA